MFTRARVGMAAAAAAAAAAVLVTAGCGVDLPSKDELLDKAESAAASAAAEATSAAESAMAEVDEGGDSGGSGESGGDPNSPICAEEGTPGAQALALGVQMLAQPDLDIVLKARAGDATYAALFDFEGIDQGIADYRVLEGRAVAGFDDPKESLDHWQELSDRMDELINGPQEPTQADIDAYTTAMGDPQALIMSQVDVAIARDEYCS